MQECKKMFYILNSTKYHNRTPENSYGGGATMPVKIGWFLFDGETEKATYMMGFDGKFIEIHGERYTISDHLTFKNKTKAEITLHKLKIDELKQASYDFFFPTSYQRTVKEFKLLVDKYPEYVL